MFGACHSGQMESGQPGAHDEALACLARLTAVSGELHQQISQFTEWANAAHDQSAGVTYAQALPLDKRVAMTERISEAIRLLARDGNRFRRLEARALYEEGLTMAQLAAIFGVSRQRVSALLREAGHGPGGAADGG